MIGLGRVLSSDFIKIRRTWIWVLIFLGPFGVISLQALNFGIRYDYLVTRYASDLWGALLEQVSSLAMVALLFGITLVASMIAGLEHKQHSWKQVLALPISRTSVYTSKLILCLILLFVSCLLLVVGTVILGVGLGFGWEVPWTKLLSNCFYPLGAAMPIVALQLWLSIVVRNQAVSLTVGILGTVVSLFSFAMPDWFPYKWIHLAIKSHVPEHLVMAGLAAGAIVYGFSVIHFFRKDVN
ncbi:ABC transporter permease [Paenibacillus sp. 481]|uniref:ABC transporter permease n=1 Tax=Paenibacillus sp. 481 TaxID=2835869 RepID=UPI001E61143C|nr:ABC transporter permease [Paenibacillus sp. 481]UHA75584.1 ABC transporter permease [Paenibacillus sp. 481]